MLATEGQADEAPLLCSSLLSVVRRRCVIAAKPVLEYQLSGISGELLENAKVYLGSPPVSEDERDNFLSSVEKSLQQSLNALGYYEAKIALDLDRSKAVCNLDIAVQPGPRVKLSKVDVRIKAAPVNIRPLLSWSTGPADLSKFPAIDPKIQFAALNMPFLSGQS